MAGAWFIHWPVWPVRPVRGLYGPGMTNYHNGSTTDHSRVVFDYNGLVLDSVAHFGMSYGISARRLTATDRNKGVYCHDSATVGLGLGLRL